MSTPRRSRTAVLRTALASLLVAVSPALAEGPAKKARADGPAEDGRRAQLLLLGTFHFKDAGMDAYKPKHDVDILSPERQRQVEEVVARLAAFRPTKVAVEVKPGKQAELDARYQEYLAGRLELKANEVYQVGFRLAKRLGHPRVYAVDADPSMALEGIFEELVQHEKEVEGLDVALRKRFEQLYAQDDALKTKQSLREHLLYLNSPERIRKGHGSYSVGVFKLEGEDGFLGADFRTAWYNRNLRIFRNLQRLTASPDERVLLVIGAGHLPILRFVAESSPEHELVEVSRFLGSERG